MPKFLVTRTLVENTEIEAEGRQEAIRKSGLLEPQDWGVDTCQIDTEEMREYTVEVSGHYSFKIMGTNRDDAMNRSWGHNYIGNACWHLAAREVHLTEEDE